MMTDPVLRHVVEITAQRDHALLDIAVISSLCELANLDSIRLFSVIPLQDRIFLQQKA